MIESKYLDLALSIAESSQVLVKWEQGGVVLLDVSCYSRRCQGLHADTFSRTMRFYTPVRRGRVVAQFLPRFGMTVTV